jgi:hypothetical protein
MAMPILLHLVLLIALDFPKEVPLDLADRVLGDDTVLTPLGEIGTIERGVEGLREQVQIHIVELQTIEHVERADSCHI